MRWWLVIVVLWLAGCQSVVGPLKYRRPARVDDPSLPIPEQERLGRDRLSLPDETYLGGPPIGVYRPDRPGQ